MCSTLHAAVLQWLPGMELCMKTLGLIGGMSWESSAQYYRLINEDVRQRLGGAHSAQLLLWSVDFAPIKQLQHDGDWDALGDHMVEAARRLQAGGAELLLVCTNTMHQLADRIEAACPLPLLHIADPTAQAIVQAGARKVACSAPPSPWSRTSTAAAGIASDWRSWFPKPMIVAACTTSSTRN